MNTPSLISLVNRQFESVVSLDKMKSKKINNHSAKFHNTRFAANSISRKINNNLKSIKSFITPENELFLYINNFMLIKQQPQTIKFYDMENLYYKCK